MKQFNFWIDWGNGQITVEADTEDEARDFAYDEVMGNIKYLPFTDFTLDLQDKEEVEMDYSYIAGVSTKTWEQKELGEVYESND